MSDHIQDIIAYLIVGLLCVMCLIICAPLFVGMLIFAIATWAVNRLGERLGGG